MQELIDCLLNAVKIAGETKTAVEAEKLRLADRSKALDDQEAGFAPKLAEIATRETAVAKIEHTEKFIKDTEALNVKNQEEANRLQDKKVKFEVYIQAEKGWVTEQKKSIAEAWKELGK